MEQNFEEFDEMNLICEKLGLPFKFDAIILKSKNFSNDQSNNILNKNYFNFMEKIKEKNLQMWKTYPKSYEERNVNDYIYKCYAGKSSAFISSAGGVRICNFAEFSEQDLTKVSFKEAWNSFEKYLYIKEDKNCKCYNCKYKVCCSNCPVTTYMNFKTKGDIVLPVEQNCREAKFIYESISTDNIK